MLSDDVHLSMLLAMWATGAVAAEAQHANRRQLVGRGHCLEADVYGPQMTVWDQVQYFTNPDFATALVNTVYCARAVALAGLDSVLNSASQNYTIFCPLDAAFLDLEQTDKAQFDALLSDPTEALRIMSFHVIDHLVLSSSFRHGDDDYMFTDNVITTHLGPDVTGGHTRYKVATAAATEGAAPTVAFRRFSEFEKLHAALGIAVPFPVAKTYGIKGASDATKRERRHKLQEYLRQTAAAFPADNPPQALLTFLGFKQPTGAARCASTGGAAAAAASEEECPRS
ncbi:hypothetical protein EMIHUDRAFT_222038 [Emiliania huxleyi CCMP1516]|uniref:FAS1 domain-containing protein n=2 Tax=Emiliania huxleyi TaxID=2903 RepID=A0A0D3KZ21_EMIH1|nr:hypothetical protein EMIHUDRAFT_222038 [Emiliania huxleyi CCMP1516]EOD41006.1 hypothetical protein EMIHUDRAFT_222038 [Emiliania huxleyi CCMP1516]|eukprot:XP_005793435.1 hypothetical protein EMIHUDRAFT_222038 [Emiliania huxleyi CCMP1516]